MGDLNLLQLLSRLDLSDVQQQCQSQSAIMNKENYLRLNSTPGLRPDGRRLLGRSMTTTAEPKTPVLAPSSFFFVGNTDDTTPDMSENFRTHRKLDRSVSEPQPSILSTRSGSQNSCSSSSSSSRYKTELCRPYEENGSCKYGEKCQFAHGRHELRTVARHPKYKTDLCKTYHTTGLCPYGPRCHFIHNDEERYLNIINRILLQQQMTSTMLEKAQLAQQQQTIANALAAQKAMQQCGTRGIQKISLRQTSSDASIPSEQLRNHLSSSLSDTSSISDSPTPSPTSSMFIEDPASMTTTSLPSIGNFPTPGQYVHGFNNAEIKRLLAAYQAPQQPSEPVMAVLEKLQASQLSQHEMIALIDYLVQRNSTGSSAALSPEPTTTSITYPSSSIMSPFSPATTYSGDFASRDNTCFPWPLPTVEL